MFILAPESSARRVEAAIINGINMNIVWKDYI